MNELTQSERKAIKAKAQPMKAAIHVGKAGVTDNVIKEIEHALKKSLVVKIRIQTKDAALQTALCEKIAAATHAVWISTIGTSAVFYQPSATVAEKKS